MTRSDRDESFRRAVRTRISTRWARAGSPFVSEKYPPPPTACAYWLRHRAESPMRVLTALRKLPSRSERVTGTLAILNHHSYRFRLVSYRFPMVSLRFPEVSLFFPTRVGIRSQGVPSPESHPRGLRFVWDVVRDF